MQSSISIALLQNDIQAFHPAYAAQQVVSLPVEGNAKAVRQGFPCQIMIFVSGADHAVQTKNDALVFYLSSSRMPLRRNHAGVQLQAWQ